MEKEQESLSNSVQWDDDLFHKVSCMDKTKS